MLKYFVDEISFNSLCVHVATGYNILEQPIKSKTIYILTCIYKHVSYLDFALITRQVYVNKHGCIKLGWDTRRNADDSPRT